MSAKIRRRANAGLSVDGAGEGGPRIVGHAAVFDSWATIYDLGDYVEREVIRPGAFAAALAANQDVRALRDHNPTLLLGRTRSGTLRLREDETGLWSEIDPPETANGRETLHLLERGDLSGMSIAYLPRDGGEVVSRRVENRVVIIEREVTSVDLYDVSVVTYPAFVETDAYVRSRADAERRRGKSLAENRSRLLALAARRRALELKSIKKG